MRADRRRPPRLSTPRRVLSATLLALAVLLAGCERAPLPPPTPGPAASATPRAPERAQRRWVVMGTPHLVLAFDRGTSTLLIRADERPDSAGAAIREGDGPEDAAGGVALNEQLWRDGGAFPDGAPAPGQPATISAVRDADEVRVLIDGIRLGDVGTANWTVSTQGSTVKVSRAVTIGRAAQGAQAALVLALPPPPGASPRLVVLDGAAYLAQDGVVQQRAQTSKATIGAVDLDPNGLILSARSGEAATPAVAVSAGITRLALGLAPARGAVGAQGTTTLQFGAPTDLQGPRSSFSPGMDARLLATGYYGNVVTTGCCGALLRASMVSYSTTVWVRDLAYAVRGYGYVLEDLGPLRDSVQAFLDRTDDLGTVPEFITLEGVGVRRGAWDSQPDLIHAAYAYVAQSGDRAFAEQNRPAIRRVATWLRASDTDGDGLPDRGDAPHGYFDSVDNGVRHTYAVASFYRAYLELAELEEFGGRDGAVYRDAAARLQAGFNRPVAAGGFWPPDRPYPVAWFAADGAVVAGFETFGVLAALASGLIPPGQRRDALLGYLHDRREEFFDGAPFGERLMLGGYDAHLRRAVDPAVEPWLLDASAPWIAALDVPVRARAGQLEDANRSLDQYLAAYNARPIPLPEFAAGMGARYGGGQTPDGGRSWDNAAWFTIVYGGHYGLDPTPGSLRIRPTPLRAIPGDAITGYRYAKAHVTLTLDEGGYSVRVDQPCALTLLPPSNAAMLSLDGGSAVPQTVIRAEPGHTYTVRVIP